MISLNSGSFNYEINEYKFNRYENVSSFNYTQCCSLLNINISDEIKEEEIKEIYYIFDCPGEDAFGHWFFESFIFFDYFLEINKIHPNLKILTTNKKKYANNFFKLFKIDNEIVNNINTSHNICFFSPVLSLNDHNIDQLLFKNLINNIVNKIYTVINNNTLYENIIFLTRNAKDNYTPNDRIVHGSEDIEENIIRLGGSVLNTYNINNVKLQFDTTNSFATIILDYGSSYLVNCIFQKNKKIIVLNNFGHFSQTTIFPSVNIMQDFISNNNNVIVVNPKNGTTIEFRDIEEFLH